MNAHHHTTDNNTHVLICTINRIVIPVFHENIYPCLPRLTINELIDLLNIFLIVDESILTHVIAKNATRLFMSIPIANMIGSFHVRIVFP
jgi:hypothetical protein